VTTEEDFSARVLAEVRERGLLMLHDKQLASVSLLVAGEPVAGSWWSHPAGKAIFAASSGLDEHDDVMATKLVGGKVTFVERALWPALLAVAESGAAWQTAGLSRPARLLRQRIDSRGEVRSDTLKGLGAVVGALEERLLCHSAQIHAESGKHVRVLQSWASWRRQKGHDAAAMDVDEGRAALEAAAARLGDAVALLPWHRFAG
jgi:hypothetical protein